MKKLRIAMVLPMLVTKNGTAKQCVELAKALKKQGHSVEIVTFAYCAATADQTFSSVGVTSLIRIPPIFTRLGISMFTIEKILLYGALIGAPMIRFILQKKKFDVLHSHDWLSMWLIAPLKTRERKLVATINDVPERERRSFIASWKLRNDRYFSSFIDIFTVLDEWNKKRLLSWLPGALKRVTVVRSGIDDGKYRTFHSEHTVRKECSIPRQAIVLVCANILSVHRRYENVIEAVSALRKTSVDMHLVVLSKRDADVAYAGRLDLLTQKLNMKPYIHFVDRFFTDEERMGYIQSSDLLVFPNYPQTWGLTVLEAMALEVPVIVSTGSGVSEVLHHKKNALVYEAGNIRDLTACIEYMIKNPERRKQIATEGKKYVLSTYTWDTYAKQMETLYS